MDLQGKLETLATAPAPAPAASFDQLADFTRRWLDNRRFSELTRAAYQRDISRYLRWCQDNGHPPLAARFTHVNAYGRHLEAEGLADRSVARALSAISSWYDPLVLLGATPANPATGADRPRIAGGVGSTFSGPSGPRSGPGCSVSWAGPAGTGQGD